MKHWFSDLLPFQRDPLAFQMAVGARATAGIERAYLGPTPIWMVADPDLVKPVLKAPEEMIDKGRLVHKLRKVLGKSSISMSGEELKRRRGVLHTTFARGAVNRYVPEMTAIIRAFVAQLMRMPSFDVHDMTSRLSLRMVSMAMFGKDVLSEADEDIIVRAVKRVEDDLSDEMFRVWPMTPWERKRRERLRAEARAEMGAVVRNVRERAPEHSAIRALEALGLTDTELCDEILTMIISGHHSTGAAGAWLLYYIATVPGLRTKIAEEATRLAGPCGEISAANLSDATISLAAVKETLRLFPSAHWFARDAKQDQEIDGRKIRTGDTILILPWLYHRSARFWENPDEFRLDRDFGSKAWLPFGAGPRVCVGMGIALMELQLMALEFAAATEMEVLSQVPAPMPRAAIILIPPRITMRVTPDIGVNAPLELPRPRAA